MNANSFYWNLNLSFSKWIANSSQTTLTNKFNPKIWPKHFRERVDLGVIPMKSSRTGVSPLDAVYHVQDSPNFSRGWDVLFREFNLYISSLANKIKHFKCYCIKTKSLVGFALKVIHNVRNVNIDKQNSLWSWILNIKLSRPQIPHWSKTEPQSM